MYCSNRCKQAAKWQRRKHVCRVISCQTDGELTRHDEANDHPELEVSEAVERRLRGLKKLLKYVSHRESPDHRPVEIDERWTDCGLGKGWREVYENAGKLAGPYVLAHHLVIAPAPDLMALVPEELTP